MDFQFLINKAQELKQESDLQSALMCCEDTFKLLKEEANQHSRNLEGSVIDIGNLRFATLQLFEEKEKYLKRNKDAATVLNNMGEILVELGKIKEAREKLERAITLTPEGMNYPDPKIVLEKLK